MNVYVVLDHVDQDSTVLGDVFLHEEDARQHILESASLEGYEIVSGHWRESCGEHEYHTGHKNYPYRVTCHKVYVRRVVL